MYKRHAARPLCTQKKKDETAQTIPSTRVLIPTRECLCTIRTTDASQERQTRPEEVAQARAAAAHPERRFLPSHKQVPFTVGTGVAH